MSETPEQRQAILPKWFWIASFIALAGYIGPEMIRAPALQHIVPAVGLLGLILLILLPKDNRKLPQGGNLPRGLLTIFMLPTLILEEWVSACVLVFCLPFILVASIWRGEGERYTQRVGSNTIKTFYENLKIETDDNGDYSDDD